MDYDPRFLEGIRRHNAGEFHAAHEYLEDYWHEFGPPRETLLRALIQFTVACLHLEMNNRRGAATMSSRVARLLETLPDEMMGLPVREIESAAHAYFAPLWSDPPGPAPEPARAPRWPWPAGAPTDYPRPPMPDKPE